MANQPAPQTPAPAQQQPQAATAAPAQTTTPTQPSWVKRFVKKYWKLAAWLAAGFLVLVFFLLSVVDVHQKVGYLTKNLPVHFADMMSAMNGRFDRVEVMVVAVHDDVKILKSGQDELKGDMSSVKEDVAQLKSGQEVIVSGLTAASVINAQNLSSTIALVPKVRAKPVKKVYGVRPALESAQVEYLKVALDARSSLTMEKARKVMGLEEKLDGEFVKFVAVLYDDELQDWLDGKPCRTCAERKLEQCAPATHLPVMEAKEIPQKPEGASGKTEAESQATKPAVPTTQKVDDYKSAYHMGSHPLPIPIEPTTPQPTTVVTNSGTGMTLISRNDNVRIKTETGMVYSKSYLLEQRSASGTLYNYHVFVRMDGSNPVYLIRTYNQNGMMSEVETVSPDRPITQALKE